MANQRPTGASPSQVTNSASVAATAAGVATPLQASQHCLPGNPVNVPSSGFDRQAEYITQAEYAQLRRCSVRTIERERLHGTGCPFVKLGGRVLYRRTDIDHFMAAHVRNSTSDRGAA
jgi:hypothetical protein